MGNRAWPDPGRGRKRETQRRTLYTALYRYMGRMQAITEEGRYFSGYDGRVHAGEPDFYVSDQIWDTLRSASPLPLFVDPQRELDMIRSYVRMAAQSGRLPASPRSAATSRVCSVTTPSL